MKGEFYKMDFRSWNLGTIDLTLEQEAAYLRLCHAMYDARGPVPNTTRLLQGIFRCGNVKASALVRQLVEAGKIEFDAAGRLLNRRVLDELAQRSRGNGPSPRASVASLTAECRSSEERVDPECGSSEILVDPECGSSATRVTPSNPLNGNDKIPVEKSREEKRRGEETRKEENSAAVEDIDQAARIEAAFGPAVAGPGAGLPGSIPDDAGEGPRLTATGRPRKHPPEAYFIEQADGFAVLNTQIDSWQRAFPNLNVAGEVMGAADWVIRNWGDQWFHRMRTWLAGKDREAAEANADRKARIEAEVAVAGQAKPSRYRIPVKRQSEATA